MMCTGPDVLARDYLRFALLVAKKRCPYYLHDEAESVAMFGLALAIHKWPLYRNRYKFSTFLATIVERRICDMVREELKHSRDYKVAVSALVLPDETVDQQDNDFESLISCLRPRERVLMRLVFLEGRTIKSAAATWGFSTTLANVKYHESINKIKSYYNLTAW